MALQHKHHHIHEPVLLNQVLAVLNPQAGESYLDLTAGYGGHARAILAQTSAPDRAVLVDRDAEAISQLKDLKAQGCKILHTDFLSALNDPKLQPKQFDLILADLGASSPHFDKAERGFSLKHDGPLDMRMDQSQPLSASELVNTLSESELTQIIRRYGEEPQAAKIARAIVEKRPLFKTGELSQLVADLLPRRGRIHPATRTFQALRIAVNGELDQLEQALPLMHQRLKPEGRLALISFHSLEDRIVKNYFREHSQSGYESDLKLLTKKAVSGDHHEIVHNPRARSAKLRAVVKIKTKERGNHAD